MTEIDLADLPVTRKEDAQLEVTEKLLPIILALRERIEYRISTEYRNGATITIDLDAPEILVAKQVVEMYTNAGWNAIFKPRAYRSSGGGYTHPQITLT